MIVQQIQIMRIMLLTVFIVEGFSKIGSYTGNGSTDGTFVYTGFRVAFLLLKRSTDTGAWQLLDNKETHLIQ